MSRQGKEVTLDMKIGVLHAYPNSDLQFERSTEAPSKERMEAKVREGQHAA